MLTSANGKIETPVSEVKVCGCCLGSNSSDANEIVECDGCGISVHEVNHKNWHKETYDDVDINQSFTKNHYLILLYFNRAAMESPKVDLLHRPLVQRPPNLGFVNL